MPTPVYTVELWRVSNLTGPYPVIGPTPPAGFKWVIRDVSFHFPGSDAFWETAGGCTLLVSGIEVAATPVYRSFKNATYRVGDIRQVVDQAQLLELAARNDGWNVSVTGYQLTTP